MRIRLKTRWLYNVINIQGRVEKYYENTFLNIGQRYFITITKETYCKRLIFTNTLWKTSF